MDKVFDIIDFLESKITKHIQVNGYTDRQLQKLYIKAAEYCLNKLDSDNVEKINHYAIKQYNKMCEVYINYTGYVAENEDAADLYKRLADERKAVQSVNKHTN
jgi:hypothetical protein